MAQNSAGQMLKEQPLTEIHQDAQEETAKSLPSTDILALLDGSFGVCLLCSAVSLKVHI